MNKKTKSLVSYFAVTFLISWGGVLVLGIPFGFPASQENFNNNWPIVFIPYLLGPLLSCVINVSIFYGKEGWKDLFKLFSITKAPFHLYFISLICAPLLVLISLVSLSYFDSNYLPKIFSSKDIVSVLFMGISIGLFGGGFLEEPGWTAFATNVMQKKEQSYIKTSIIIGLIWGVWHILPTAWGSGDEKGDFDFMLFFPPLLFYIGVLPNYRLIMTFIFYKYRNVYLSILMHMSLTATTLFVLVPNVQGMHLAFYYLMLTTLLLVINIVIASKNKNLKIIAT